jgi:hypothetical protein
MSYLLMDLPANVTLPNPAAGKRVGTELVSVNPIHHSYIYTLSNSLSFTGYVPGNFQISLSAAWGPVFPSMSLAELSSAAGVGGGALTERVAAAAGASTKLRALSALLWEGPAYLQLSLPIQINAYDNTKTEIIDKLTAMADFITPTLSTGGVMIPPGPIPAQKIIEGFNVGSAGAQNAEDLANMTSVLNEEQTIVVQLGKFFRMYPCVVTNVVMGFEGQPEHETSNPLSVDFQLELQSYYAVSRDDIRAWLRGGFGIPAGTS